MGLIEAIILGIVQGLTEFLPVSSSGHIVIAKSLLGISKQEQNLLMTIVLHAATALSTIFVFRKDIKEIIRGLCQFTWNKEFQFSLKVILSMVPATIVGLLFENEIEQIVFDFSAEANILKNVEENTFNLALEKLGKTKVIDIVGICGYYSLISMTLNVFKVPCDTPDWPIPRISDFSNMLKIESKK